MATESESAIPQKTVVSSDLAYVYRYVQRSTLYVHLSFDERLAIGKVSGYMHRTNA